MRPEATNDPGEARPAAAGAAAWALRAAGFLGVLLLANVLSQELGLKYFAPGANNRSLGIYLYQREGLEAEVLFVGTSKTNFGVIPAVIEREASRELGQPITAFCLGQPGTSAFANALVLRDVVAANGPPLLALLEVTPGCLNTGHGNLGRSLRQDRSTRDLLAALPRIRGMGQAAAAAAGAFRGLANFALFAWHRILFPHPFPQLEASLRRHGSAHGPGPGAASGRLSDLAPKERREKLHQMADEGRRMYMNRYRIGGLPETGLWDAHRLAREQGFRLVTFNPPVTAEYRRAVYGEKAYQVFLDYMADAARQGQTEFHDFNDGRLTLGAEDFYDFGHLSASGARKLSRLLAREVILPCLRGAADRGPTR